MSESYQALIETLYQARLENRRLRISQLRRMANACLESAFRERVLWRRLVPRYVDGLLKIERFHAACLAEVERLRGEG